MNKEATIPPFRKIVQITFPPEIARTAVVCLLAKKFDIEFSIIQAEINPRKEGSLTLEISGSKESCEQGLKYLRSSGAKVTDVDQVIKRDEKSCIHCGLCTAMCPASALYLDRQSRKIVFDNHKCTACGICVKECTVHAMFISHDTHVTTSTT